MKKGPAMMLLVACTVISCAEDEEPRQPMSRGEFCQRWAAAACNDEVVADCQSDSTDVCMRAQEQDCLERVPVTFTDRNAEQCLSRVEDAYSDAQLNPDEAQAVLRLQGDCGRLVAGPRNEGESCMVDNDCDAAGGYQCIVKGGKGTCQTPETIGPGLDCTEPQAICEDEFFCDGTHCVEQSGAGQVCDRTRECAEGTYCVSGTCTERLSLNAPCSSDEQCASGLCYGATEEQVCSDRIQLARAEPICDAFR